MYQKKYKMDLENQHLKFKINDLFESNAEMIKEIERLKSKVENLKKISSNESFSGNTHELLFENQIEIVILIKDFLTAN